VGAFATAILFMVTAIAVTWDQLDEQLCAAVHMFGWSAAFLFGAILSGATLPDALLLPERSGPRVMIE
jgi:hypothetical protein